MVTLWLWFWHFYAFVGGFAYLKWSLSLVLKCCLAVPKHKRAVVCFLAKKIHNMYEFYWSCWPCIWCECINYINNRDTDEAMLHSNWLTKMWASRTLWSSYGFPRGTKAWPLVFTETLQSLQTQVTSSALFSKILQYKILTVQTDHFKRLLLSELYFVKSTYETNF